MILYVTRHGETIRNKLGLIQGQTEWDLTEKGIKDAEELRDTVDKLDTVQDILQQFCQTVRNSQKRSSDEQYAQKTVEFEKKVGELNDALDEIANPDDDKKEEKKEGEDE